MFQSAAAEHRSATSGVMPETTVVIPLPVSRIGHGADAARQTVARGRSGVDAGSPLSPRPSPSQRRELSHNAVAPPGEPPYFPYEFRKLMEIPANYRGRPANLLRDSSGFTGRISGMQPLPEPSVETSRATLSRPATAADHTHLPPPIKSQETPSVRTQSV